MRKSVYSNVNRFFFGRNPASVNSGCVGLFAISPRLVKKDETVGFPLLSLARYNDEICNSKTAIPKSILKL